MHDWGVRLPEDSVPVIRQKLLVRVAPFFSVLEWRHVHMCFELPNEMTGTLKSALRRDCLHIHIRVFQKLFRMVYSAENDIFD